MNESKSKVDKVTNDIKFIGFGFYYSPQHDEIRVLIHKKSVKRIKDKIRAFKSRSCSIDMKHRIIKVNQLIIGWINYYKIADLT